MIEKTKEQIERETLPDLPLIRSLFERKDYTRILEVFEASSTKVETIRNEGDAELAMFLAFTYFNMKNYNYSIACAEMLLDHIELNKQQLVARGLVENLLIILIDSHVCLGRRLKAYLCCKRAKRFVVNEQEEVIDRSKYLSKQMAELTFARLDFILPILFILISIAQIYSSPFNSYIFILVALGMLGAIYFLLRAKTQIKALLSSLFEKMI